MNKPFSASDPSILAPRDYDALLDAMNHTALVSMTDAKGTIIYANQKFVEVSKYALEELIGQNHRILKSGHQPQEMFEELWRTISAGRMWRGEIKNKAKDGSYYWVDTSIAPILDQEGKPERYVSIRFLITDKKKIEEDLSKQNELMIKILRDLDEEREKMKEQVRETMKFSLAVQNANEHIVITDRDGIVLYANPAAEITTGYSIKEMVGTKAGVLWGRQMDSVFYRKMWDTIKVQKQTFRGEINNVRKGGVKYIAHTTISPVLDKEGEVEFFIGLERDITREKEIDKTKTEFVSLASHQLRTPLSAINWYTEMLSAEDVGPLNPDQKRYLTEIYSSSKRMVELVSALLNVSRLELGTFSVEPQPTNLVSLMKSVTEEEKPQVEKKKITLNIQAQSDIPPIECDPKLLHIVFQNLLSNAIKYTPEGGSVNLQMILDQARKSLLISVADTGIGIPKQQQERIFDKLFRADNAREVDTDGTGLGLYIVKSIIEQAHGTIEFASPYFLQTPEGAKQQQGTQFSVSIPLSGMKARIGTKSLS